MHNFLRTRIKHDLRKKISAGKIFSKLFDRYAFARDAGFYRLLPQIVVKAGTVQDIAALFQIASQRKRSIVFRAGGTSLSGQAIGEDILVEVKQGWRNLEILDEGRQIKLQPGVVAAKANQHLEPLGFRIGPDPGSIRSALIGGIVANNASGIGSGNHLNSYKTLVAMEMILPSGLILNTANSQDDEKLRIKAPLIHSGLLRIRDHIRGSEDLSWKIQNKYKLKNTMGYSLNSFLDYEKPLDILAHLMVGSEGTLGFISQVTLKTVAIKPYSSTALLLLNSITDAAKLVPRLKRSGCYALEIMDDAAIRAVQHIPGLPDEFLNPIQPGSAALLVEYQAQDPADLAGKIEKAITLIQQLQPSIQPNFFSDPRKRNQLWKMRRELGPLHAATRPAGTTVLSEDVCFKVKDLARAIKDLKFLFKHYHYDDVVIFGHAGDGNLHFKLNLDFSQPTVVREYGKFMEDLVELVIEKYAGSLKAEHGTGRNMAPFVEREWGSEAYAIMVELKQLIDPEDVLNPGVLINSDEKIHLKNIKSIPLVDPLVDKCIECGLCEPWCPSADLTLTPRQRISVLRELELLEGEEGNEHQIARLRRSYRYAGVDTCATDGLCGLSCPVDIDTGLLMKQLRSEYHGSVSKAISRAVHQHFSATLTLIRILLRILTPTQLLLGNRHLYEGLKRIAGLTHGVVPAFNTQFRSARMKLPRASKGMDADIIYFPSCLSRGLSDPAHPTLSVAQAFKEVLDQAGLQLAYPQKLNDLCCGLTYSSKGFSEAALQAAIQTTEMLWISSLEGRVPIVMDTSPCTNHMKHYDQLLSGIHLARWRDLKIIDLVEYLHDEVLHRLSLWQARDRVVLHPTCSTRRMGIEKQMEAIAQRCARQVIIPVDVGCCGFAGDRGLLVPALTESATRAEALEVKQIKGDGHYSTSRTCEIGMGLATDESYQSLIYLVHDALVRKSC